MIEKLPDEILSSIATILSPEIISTCTRVCHSWYAAFIPTLYKNVEIKDKGQLDQFLDTLRASDTLNPTNPLGHFIRKLSLSLLYDRGHIASLTHLCPFVIEYNDHECWDGTMLLGVVQQWKHIKNFGILRIRAGQDISFDFFRNRVTKLITNEMLYLEISKCITELPCIEQLTLRFSAANPLRISPRELETLHTSLPRLWFLKIASLFIHGEMPEQITPCDSVCHLYLKNPKGRLWGQYFARKYENLKKLNFSWVDSTASENTKTELTALARSCRHLEHFHCLDPHLIDLNQQCIEILHTTGAPLTYFYLNLSHTFASATTISNFHKTLSKMEINVYEEDKLGIVLEATRACLCLVDLHLSCICIDLEVGHVLNCCQYLKYLKLYGNQIRADSSYATNTQHGLRTLDISGDIDEGVFPYLSQHCPRIFSLSCGFNACNPMPYFLYFPSPSLETLRVDWRFHEKAVFKVMRVGKLDKIILVNTPIYERQTEDSARWFYKDKYNRASPLQELGRRETGSSSDQPRDDYEGWSLQISQESSQHQNLADTLRNGNIVRILCHYVDQIYLDGNRVRY